MKDATVLWHCPECSEITVVVCTPGIPAQLSGPPEKCYPGEDAGIDPEYCEKCGELIDKFEALKEANDQDAAEREYAAECRADRDREDLL